jgi:S-adenosylmethionine hydrolase
MAGERSRRPVVALLTDFGLRDHYAGTMKGVVLGICPDAALVDITHDVPAHDVLAGALELEAAWPYFPPGTVFLAVVDPGVGSARRALAAEGGGCRFVGPDNGLLSLVLERAPVERLVELTDRRFSRPTISRTFEGRDRFAPAAAWLAAGTPIAELGQPIDSYERLAIPAPRELDSGVDGQVLKADRFGNLITNLPRRVVERVGPPHTLAVEIAGCRIAALSTTYADVPPGELCVLFGSSDRLEVAVNGGSAADRVGARAGTPVRVARRAW